MKKKTRPDPDRRKAQRVPYGEDIRDLYDWFIRAPTDHIEYLDDQGAFETRTELFFGLHLGRSVVFAKAIAPFKMPGKKWAAENRPFDLVPGVGERNVEVGQALILRSDPRSPERCEVEFGEQVFVLSEAEFNEVKKKVEVVV